MALVLVMAIQVYFIYFVLYWVPLIIIYIGSGFYVKPGRLWILKGIVSSSLATGEFGCGVETYSVFTHVASYMDWITDSIKSMATNSNTPSTTAAPKEFHDFLVFN